MLAALTLVGCATTEPTLMEEGKVRVTATLFPLYEFAQVVGGDHVDVTMLLPAGAEPHSYEPKPSDILAMQESDMFIYIGEEMEPWAHDLLEGVNNPSLMVIEAASFSEIITGDEHDYEEDHDHMDDEHAQGAHEHEEDHADEDHEHTDEEHEHAEEEHEAEGHDHDHAYDPHVWLSFHNDILIVEEIAEHLSEIDPDNAAEYNANAAAYIERLQALDQEYQTTLTSCTKDEFISGGHDVFGYLEHEYGIKGVQAIENLEPNTEPTPARMKELSDLVEEHHIKYVLTEVLVSAEIAEAISEETGAQVLTFNPAANLPKKDFDAGTSFISVMKDNLDTLATALECN